jgi:hypothetical protein
MASRLEQVRCRGRNGLLFSLSRRLIVRHYLDMFSVLAVLFFFCSCTGISFCIIQRSGYTLFSFSWGPGAGSSSVSRRRTTVEASIFQHEVSCNLFAFGGCKQCVATDLAPHVEVTEETFLSHVSSGLAIYSQQQMIFLNAMMILTLSS